MAFRELRCKEKGRRREGENAERGNEEETRATVRRKRAVLNARCHYAILLWMKVLSLAEAQANLNALCKKALAGEVIRFQGTDGCWLELKAVGPLPRTPLSEREMSECYDDEEWASFENKCAKASA